jgi:hypothetical protein
VFGIDLASTAGPALRLPLGVLAGVLATLAMDVATGRLPEGRTPPTVAAGVLTGTHPDAAPERLASVVHYVAGGLTGPLFVWVLYASEALVGPSLLGVLAATAVLFVLMVAFFVGVVLPRAEGLARQRLRKIRRAWALSAGVYLTVCVPLVVAGSALV